jgi:hypothetical protein
MASKRRARRRQSRHPLSALTDAAIVAVGRPTSRNRRKFHAARTAASRHVDAALFNTLTTDLGQVA